MSQPFIAEIRMYPFTYAPMSWAQCDGQLMAISQNMALFAIIGSTYGGDGRISMGAPNLRGRAVVGSGIGPGLLPRSLGQPNGIAGVALSVNQIPAHSHDVQGAFGPAGGATAEGNASSVLGPQRGSLVYKKNVGHDANLHAETISISGSGQIHENRQPYLAIPFCICLEGIFPPRN